MIRRYIAEILGTFTIVFAPVAAAANLPASSPGIGLIVGALVSGFSVLAMVFALGPISAAHFNPAVTLGFAVARRFPWKFVVPYWICQLTGSVLAALLAAALFGSGHGVPSPTYISAMGSNIGTETVLTFFLMLVIIAVATDARVSAAVPGVAIGLTVVFGVFIGGPMTGAAMNPARYFGPALLSKDGLAFAWLYTIGPAAGAVIASVLYEAIRIHPEHAKGAPNELLQALEDISEAAP